MEWIPIAAKASPRIWHYRWSKEFLEAAKKRVVEGSALSVRQTLREIGVPRSTFYTWYQRHLEGGPESLCDRKPRPRRVWNRIPDRVRLERKPRLLSDNGRLENHYSPWDLERAAARGHRQCDVR